MRPRVNCRQIIEGRELLAGIRENSVAAGFFDPQWRANLDRLKFGNEGERQGARKTLPAMDEAMIREFCIGLGRVIRPRGYLFLWLDKFALGSGLHVGWLDLARTGLRIVDIATWDTGRIAMGMRLRQRGQYLIIAQKVPSGVNGSWRDKGIPDVWPEAVGREEHPHAKPFGLIVRLISAVSKPKETIVDPAAGSYVVLDACRFSGRRFIGGDLRP